MLRLALKVVVSVLGLRLLLDGLGIQLSDVAIGSWTGSVLILVVLIASCHTAYRIGADSPKTEPERSPPRPSCTLNLTSVRAWFNRRDKLSAIGSKIILAQILFVLLWSSGFVGAKFGLDYTGAFSFLFLRYALLSGILIVFVVATCRMYFGSWLAIRQVAIIGILAHALYLSTMWIAFALGATAGMAALIGGLQPIITGMLASRAFDERIQPHQWLGLIIGFAALLLITGNSVLLGGSAIAYLLLFASVGCITMATLHQRWMDVQSNCQPMPLAVNLAIQCTASTIALWFPAYFLEGFAVTWRSEFVFTLVWLSLVVSLGGYGTMWFLLRRCKAAEVASLSYFTVPVTMGFGYLAFGDTLTFIDVVGLLVAAVGVLLVQCAKPIFRYGHISGHSGVDRHRSMNRGR